MGKEVRYVKNSYPFCQNCGADLTEQSKFCEGLKCFICEKCGQPLYNPSMDIDNMRFPGMIQICERCGTILNNQDGFTDWKDTWICCKCGFMNPIGEDNNYESADRIELEKQGNTEMTIKEARIIEKEFDHKSI